MNKQPTKFSREWWESMTMPEPNSGCLFWLGWANDQGYGFASIRGRTQPVSRIAYECAYGLFDPALKVCHRCDTPPCVEPTHLFLGTQRQNLADMRAKGRAREWGIGPKVTRLVVEKGSMLAALALSLTEPVSHCDGEGCYILHHIRTSAMVSHCRYDSVAPSTGQHQASAKLDRHLDGSLYLSVRLASNAMVAR